MFRTRWIRNLFNRPFNLRRRHRQMAKTRKPVRLRLEALEERVTPDSTTVVAGNVTVNFYGNAQSPAFLIPVTVNDNAGGKVTAGNVTISLVNSNSTITLGSATVATNGVADVDIDVGKLPANLSVGSFQLEESFSGSGSFDASSANGTLTISALTTSVVSTTVSYTYSNPTKVTVSGSELIPIGADASNYVVLYEGEDGHTLHISNSTINGNVGVGSTGVVHINGHADLNGTLDFAGSAQFHDSGDDDDSGDHDHGHGPKGDDDHGPKGDDKDEDEETSGPIAINVNDAAVTNALNTVNALSASLAGMGTSIAINGSQTINESAGLLVTVNGVSYRVFNVTSFHMGDDDHGGGDDGDHGGGDDGDHGVLTINGDGSGIPVVFNFGGKGALNLGGDVTLTNGLTPDQVLWNVTTSGAQVHLHGNDEDRPDDAFQGIILAPNDRIDVNNANLIGRVFGGDDEDMQIVGQVNITAPIPVATISASTLSSFTVSVDVTSSTATVSSGTVTFDVLAGNETIVLGTATVGANGVATFTVTDQTTLQELASLQPGTYEVVETFSGSNPFAPSSTTTTVTVTPEPTTIVVPPTVNVTVNNNTTFNITVNVNTPSGPVTSGTVTINLVNGNQTIQLGTATVGPNGTFTLTVNESTISSLPPGQFQLIVNFNAGPGSTNANGSTTTTLNLLPALGPNATTSNPAPTNVIPGNGVSNFLGGPATIPVMVNSPLGAVPEGTVTITLLTPTGSIVIGSGPVSGGAAAVPVTVPAGLLPGFYSMLESFTDNGTFLGSNATGTLTVQPLNPLVAALELALEAAAIPSLGNPGAMGELELFSQVFLHQQLPTSIPALVNGVQSLLPQTGGFALPAIGLAEFLAREVQIENPI